MKYEVYTLGKHYLHVHTSKGFTMYANAKLVNGQLSSFTDSMSRRGGSWVIDVWRFLNKKDFPVNPIYTAVFGFADDDNEVQVTATDIDVESISGVNGQLVDIGNISLAPGVTLPVNTSGYPNKYYGDFYTSEIYDTDVISMFGEMQFRKGDFNYWIRDWNLYKRNRSTGSSVPFEKSEIVYMSLEYPHKFKFQTLDLQYIEFNYETAYADVLRRGLIVTTVNRYNTDQGTKQYLL